MIKNIIKIRIITIITFAQILYLIALNVKIKQIAMNVQNHM
jgi:hypothetical protein